MKVGIDLSSTNTGLVILSDNNKLVFHGNFQLWDSNRFMIVDKVNEMIDCIRFKRMSDIMNDKDSHFIMVGIELADFKNANITNRFNLLAGMIISRLAYWKVCNRIGKKIHLINTLKLFNSNEWQRFLLEKYKNNLTYIQTSKDKVDCRITYFTKVNYSIDMPMYIDKTTKLPTVDSSIKIMLVKNIDIKKIKNNHIPREVLKALARIFCEEHCLEYTKNWTEDECDAYCIAYFLEKLRDRTQMHQEVKTRDKAKAKSEKQALRDKYSKEHKISKLKDIVIKYKSLSKLTKAQQRALEKAENQLKELKGAK